MPEITPVPKEQRTEPYWQELNKVVDPEINIGIVDLGLVYKVDIDKKGHATVYMSLTSPTCPFAHIILQQTEDQMNLQKNIKSTEIVIVWNPPWSQEMIDPDIRELLLEL